MMIAQHHTEDEQQPEHHDLDDQMSVPEHAEDRDFGDRALATSAGFMRLMVLGSARRSGGSRRCPVAQFGHFWGFAGSTRSANVAA